MLDDVPTSPISEASAVVCTRGCQFTSISPTAFSVEVPTLGKQGKLVIQTKIRQI